MSLEKPSISAGLSPRAPVALRLREPRARDLQAVFDLLLARDLADLGFADFTLADLQEEWNMSGFQLEADAVLCEDADGTLIGYGAIRRTQALGAVAPEHERRGGGALLLGWLEARERELGRHVHRQAIVNGSRRAEELLNRAGYRYEASYSRMVRTLERLPPIASIPGVEFRDPDVAGDARAIYRLDADSFADSPDYQPMSFETFVAHHLEVHDFAPALSVVAERGTELIGFLLTRLWREEAAGHVDVLAVGPTQQGRGVGTAMVRRALARYAAAGLREAQLGVASTNPRALRLYERLGMSARFRIDVYAKPVGADGEARHT